MPVENIKSSDVGVVTATELLDTTSNEKPFKPIPLNLDWESPEGKAHHEQMSNLSPDDPVAKAHFSNIGQPHPKADPKSQAS